MRWLLCDYGEVISLPQPAEDRLALEEIAGRGGPPFWATYWEHRPDHDRGKSSTLDYWTTVLGHQPTPSQLAALVRCDVKGWLHPNMESLAATARAAARGVRLAILSNAPHEVADALDQEGWLREFSPRVFSCRLGAIKPARDVYLSALAALGADASEVAYLDDRAENVTAANDLGLAAQLFVAPAQIDAIGEANA